MHVNGDAPIRYVERTYDQVDEKSNDDDYDVVANEHGTENKNTHGHNGNGNDHSEGGGTSAIVGGNNDTTSIGSGDGRSSNVP